MRFRNYFTTVLKSSTWSTASIWVFSFRNHIARFQAEWLFQDRGKFHSDPGDLNTHIEKRVMFERWPCLCQTSFFAMEPDTVRVDLWEHLVLLLLFIVSYNIFLKISLKFSRCNNSMQIYTQCLKHTSNSLSYSRKKKMDLAVLNNVV